MPPAIGYGIVPALTVDDAVRLGRPPSVRVILIDGPIGLQHGIDDPPCLIHIIGPRKSKGISFHRIPKQQFIRLQLCGVGSWETRSSTCSVAMGSRDLWALKAILDGSQPRRPSPAPPRPSKDQ
jgi:hypothetical protein